MCKGPSIKLDQGGMGATLGCVPWHTWKYIIKRSVEAKERGKFRHEGNKMNNNKAQVREDTP